MNTLVRPSLFLLALFAVLASSHTSSAQDDSNDPSSPTTASVSVCFVPAHHCSLSIVHAINQAKSSIRVQAFGFTSRPILSALVAAKQRGVDVEVILDGSNDSSVRKGHRSPKNGEEEQQAHGRQSGTTFIANAGVPVFIDDSLAIAHSKIIIIDEHLVVGGSFNFTAAADRKNAENVTFIDSPVVAQWYLANWESRRSASRELAAHNQ